MILRRTGSTVQQTRAVGRMRRGRLSSNTMQSTRGIALSRTSWNAAGTQSWRISRRSSNAFQRSMRNRYSLTSEQEARIRFMGENFAGIWESDACPPALKKMIFRTIIEEIIVCADAREENAAIHDSLEGWRTHSSRNAAASLCD